MFAFDELTTLMNSRGYQEQALERTRLWALRCLAEHAPGLTEESTHRPYQQLWGVIQGAQYEDLRRRAARDLGAMDSGGQAFDGFGIGGALEKENLGTIVGWVTDELPEGAAPPPAGHQRGRRPVRGDRRRGRHLRLRLPVPAWPATAPSTREPAG